jgi:LacI family transcriptional regulator
LSNVFLLYYQRSECAEGSAITLKDIARETGYSVKTVSRALNGHADVNIRTRRAIQRIVNKLGYEPNWAAQSLRRQQTRTIGYVIPNLVNGFFGEIGDSIAGFFHARGYSTIICFSANDRAAQIDALGSLAAKNIDGIILAPVGGPGAHLFAPPLLNVPLVLIDNMFEDVKLPCVLHENEHNTRLLVSHLVSHGHTRIACVTGPLEETSGLERLKGYRRALNEAGIHQSESLVRVTEWESHGGYSATLDLLRAGPARPTAIFYANSQQLLGGYKALHELQVRIPEDIAVVGFDHPDVMDALSPRPTVLEKMEQRLGTAAARLLWSLLQGEKQAPRTIRIRSEVSIGRSCGCLPSEEAVSQP